MEMYDKLNKICYTKENVDLKTMCSMHIGGVGSYVCFPKDIKELKRLINFLQKNKQEFFVVGNGSNVIFEDGGYSAVLISLKKIHNYSVKGKTIVAEAGLTLFALNYICKTEGLGGLEWSYGIPASVGGSVFMNAGAYGHEMGDFVKYVWVLSNGKIKRYTNKEMEFSYRHSKIQTTKDIILKASFSLKKADEKEIDERQKQIFAYRKCCQPYDTYNAGSIFKRANNISVGKTIDKLGLKSVKIGDIQISEKHANFFINLGNGTSRDLHALVDKVKRLVKMHEDIDLEEEVIFVKDKRNKL